MIFSYNISWTNQETQGAFTEDLPNLVGTSTSATTPAPAITYEINLNDASASENLTAAINYSVYTETLTGNITYAYHWYKNGTLNATTLLTDSNLLLYYPLDNDTDDYYGTYNTTNGGALRNTSAKVGNSFTFLDSDSVKLNAGDIGINRNVCFLSFSVGKK